MLYRTILVLTPLCILSCATTADLEKMGERVRLIEKWRTDTEYVLQRDMKRMENLNEQIKASTKELRRHGAGLGARVDGLEEDKNRLMGRIEELDHLAGTAATHVDLVRAFIDERFGVALVPLPKDMPVGRADMLKFGQTKLKENQFETALAVFQNWLKKFPQGDETTQVQFSMATAYRKMKRYNSALKIYNEVFEPHAHKGKKAPTEASEALWQAARTLDERGDCDKSLGMYKYLVQLFKQSPRAAQAKTVLKDKNCQ